jgi:hypothetical protein
MNRVILKATDLSQIKSIPHLREILVLGYILDTLRSSQRLIMATSEKSGGTTQARDNLFGLLTNISFMYEGMKTASGLLKKLAPSLPRTLHADVAWVISEVESRQDSLFNTVLERMRNGVGFHFNLAISESHLEDAVISYPVVFGEGATRQIGDWSYVFSDNVVAQYFALYDLSPGGQTDKVRALSKKLGEYNHRFCKTLDHVVAQLIFDFSEIG